MGFSSSTNVTSRVGKIQQIFRGLLHPVGPPTLSRLISANQDIYSVTDGQQNCSIACRSGAGLAVSVQCLTTDMTTEVWSPAEAKNFPSSHDIQIISEVHPVSYPMGTGGPFLGVTSGHAHLAPKSRMSCIPSLPWQLHDGSGVSLPCRLRCHWFHLLYFI
jgi:hypothetical protein